MVIPTRERFSKEKSNRKTRSTKGRVRTDNGEKKPKRVLASESDIQYTILVYLKSRGIEAWRNNNVGVYNRARDTYVFNGRRGVSDILGILPDGRFLAIECKTEKGQLTHDQYLFLTMINDNNGLAFCARSIDFVKERLDVAQNVLSKSE